jgi:stage IV sporulation protein FB
VLLHEFGHALAAARYGIKTPDIALLPIGGVARLQRMPDEPAEELIVALAGPLVNLVIAGAILLGSGFRALVGLEQSLHFTTHHMSLLQQVFSANVMLFAFNLFVPAFPMDGGRVLRALLAMRMDYGRATRIAASVGQALAFALGLWGLLSGNILVILVAVFVFMGAGQEAAAVELREVARRSHVADAMITDFRTLPENATLGDAVDALLATSQREFPVTGEGGQVLGIITRDDMIAGLRQSGPNAPASGFMRRGVQSVRASSNFEQAFRMMQETRTPAVLVMDDRNRLAGLITPENVGEMMMVHAALGQGPGDGKRPTWPRPWDPGATVPPDQAIDPGLAPPPVASAAENR